MNARTPDAAMAAAVAPTFRPDIPLDDIVASKTNPRKRFDQAALAELAVSIQAQGVAQPILVRPHPGAGHGGQYELIVGERRWRAAKLAGLTVIPALVRHLDDIDVIEIQIIENLQRADVHPIEEATGYEALMAQHKPTGEFFNADDIAGKVGKSRRYVYHRLQLLKLCPEARDAFFDGKIDIKKAEAISRIGHHDTQRAALKDIGNVNVHSREALDRVRRYYMLNLKDAPFDVKCATYYGSKSLHPIAGPCAQCPKRTGANPDLFSDIDGKDICSDVKCYGAKSDAAMAIKRAAYEAAGRKVITGKDAAAIMPSKWGLATGYTEPDRTCYEPGLGNKAGKTYQQILGKDLPVLLIENPHTNRIDEIVNVAAAKKLMKDKGILKVEAREPTGRGASSIVTPRGPSETDITARGYRTLRESFAQGASEAAFRFMIKTLVTEAMEWGGNMPVLIPVYLPALIDADNWDGDAAGKQLLDIVDALPAAQLPRALLDCLADYALDHHTNIQGLDVLLANAGIKPKDSAKLLAAELKAREAAAAAAREAAKKPTAPVSPESAAAKKKGGKKT